VISVDGVETSQRAGGGALLFTVAPLIVGAVVKAKQDTGEGFTPWSPEVTVEDAAIPPGAAPRLPDDVGLCSQCVMVDGMVPGCEVELEVLSNPVGKGIADNGGRICLDVDLVNIGHEQGMVLESRMIVCGKAGPTSSTQLVRDPPLPQPVLIGPLFGCQSVVPTSNLHRGALVRYETRNGADLGAACSCWIAANVSVLSPLITNESVRAQQFWSRDNCKAAGSWSDFQLVVAPDDRIKPKVLEVLIDGDKTIRVQNQVIGADLVVRIRPGAGQPPDEFGPRPASKELEIGLNGTLSGGNIVSVVQTLCGVSVESDPVTVQPKPTVILAPVVIGPLFGCGSAVQVSNVSPGALVRIYEDGMPIGIVWAGEEISLSITASPSLVAGGKVTAKQWVGGSPSPESEPAVLVSAMPTIHIPRVLEPVALGDTEVWVSGVTPGCRVSVLSGTTTLGQTDAAEPMVRISVAPVNGPVQATARLCSQSSTGLAVAPIDDPCSNGPLTNVGNQFRSFASFNVPKTMDGDPFTTSIEGQLYFPTAGDGTFDPNAHNLPLVIIAHGLWGPGVKSYLGYDYLAEHLVRWGMVVFSVNMDDVNGRSTTRLEHQYSRAEIILHVIDELFADPQLEGRLNREHVGLIGHSMGGEGVVVAQFLNQTGARGYNIRGVVSIAPTHWRKEVTLRETKYLQLLGSMDLLLNTDNATGPGASSSGFQIYDRAWRPKSHFFIHKARHNPFNHVWLTDGDAHEANWPGSLPEQDHQRVAKGLINAFLQDALLEKSAYGGYLQGTILPQGIRDLEFRTQHSQEPRTLVDDFGDLDEQASLPDKPLDRAVNSLGNGVIASGAGLSKWENIQFSSLANCPHDTKGTHLCWTSPDVLYASSTGGISAGPTDVVSLRIAQFYEDPTLNPVGEPADLFVTITDGVAEASMRLGAVAQVGYPFTGARVFSVLQSVRLPLDAFQALNPGLNLGRIESVRLHLAGRASGNILVDDLEVGS